MTNVAVEATQLSPLGAATNSGLKIGWVTSKAKAAQNDTWTVGNAKSVIAAFVSNDAAGTMDACTCATNVVTLTGATTGAASGVVIYI